MTHHTPETLPAHLPKDLARRLAAALLGLGREAHRWTLAGSRARAVRRRCERRYAASPPAAGSASERRLRDWVEAVGEAAEECDRRAGELVRMRRELLDSAQGLDPDAGPEDATLEAGPDGDGDAAGLAQLLRLFAPFAQTPEGPAQ